MKKHTADTLKYYLNKDVYFMYSKLKIIISAIELREDADGVINPYYSEHGDLKDYYSPSSLYPILKSVEDLTVDENYIISRTYAVDGGYPDNYFNVCLHECPQCYYHAPEFHGVSIEYIEYLLNIGAGAIPSNESNTGYVDLFDMPCVTPKQVDEGFQI